MRIIKEGNWVDPDTWKAEVNCPHCRAVLEVETHDLEYHPPGGAQWDPWPEKFTVTCASCKGGIKLDRERLPPSVRRARGASK